MYGVPTIDEFEEQAPRASHKGYISLLPFMVGLMRHDDAKVGRLLDLVASPGRAVDGARHPEPEHGEWSCTGTEENYIGGADLWINMNYLLVERLLVCFGLTMKA